MPDAGEGRCRSAVTRAALPEARGRVAAAPPARRFWEEDALPETGAGAGWHWRRSNDAVRRCLTGWYCFSEAGEAGNLVQMRINCNKSCRGSHRAGSDRLERGWTCRRAAHLLEGEGSNGRICMHRRRALCRPGLFRGDPHGFRGGVLADDIVFV